jgi:hypothetical protein
MCTYTGVLLGVTTIPIWKENVRLLPVHFGASAMGSAASALELRGHTHSALNALALGAAIFETAAAPEPFEGVLPRLATALSGPVPLLLRLFGKRKAAAACTLAGSLLTRFVWVHAGKRNL